MLKGILRKKSVKSLSYAGKQFCASPLTLRGPVVVSSNVVGKEDDFKVIPKDKCLPPYRYDSLYRWITKHTWRGGKVQCCCFLL